MFDSGRVKGQSIRPYVASVAAQHRRRGLQDPTDGPLVAEVRAGYRALDSQRSGKPPPRSAPIPAEVAISSLKMALVAQTSDDFVRHSAVVVCFLIATRVESILSLTPADVRVVHDVLEIQVNKFKGSDSGMVPRMSLKIPLEGPDDPVRQLFDTLLIRRARCLWLFGKSTSACLTRSDLNTAVTAALSRDGVKPPLGVKFTPRSLRSGGLTAMHSIGVPQDMVLRIANHSGDSVIYRHYVDPLTRPTPAERVLFGRFLFRPQAVISASTFAAPIPVAPNLAHWLSAASGGLRDCIE